MRVCVCVSDRWSGCVVAAASESMSECAEYTRERETVCVPLGRTSERGSNEPTGATLGVLVLTRPDLGLSCHFYLQGGRGVGRGRVG